MRSKTFKDLQKLIQPQSAAFCRDIEVILALICSRNGSSNRRENNTLRKTTTWFSWNPGVH